MGLHVHSLAEIPDNVQRAYYIYLLDYGWQEDLGNAIMTNFTQMSDIASRHDAVVIQGTAPHFYDEVFSWHSINGEDPEKILPAILITNRNPQIFYKHTYDINNTEDDLKFILISLQSCCKTTTDVVNLVNKIFNDIKYGRDLDDFKVARTTNKGIGEALVDSLILEPNIGGIGVNIKKIIQRFLQKQ